jgi:hypothetical protein
VGELCALAVDAPVALYALKASYAPVTLYALKASYASRFKEGCRWLGGVFGDCFNTSAIISTAHSEVLPIYVGTRDTGRTLSPQHPGDWPADWCLDSPTAGQSWDGGGTTHDSVLSSVQSGTPAQQQKPASSHYCSASKYNVLYCTVQCSAPYSVTKGAPVSSISNP